MPTVPFEMVIASGDRRRIESYLLMFFDAVVKDALPSQTVRESELALTAFKERQSYENMARLLRLASDRLGST